MDPITLHSYHAKPMEKLSIRDRVGSAQFVFNNLAELGFLSMPGPFSSQPLSELVGIYDEVMANAGGPSFNVGSTTTRMSDLLSFNVLFDDVFLYESLLAVCNRFFEHEYKLSSFLGRTLRPGTPAQALHADLPRNSEDAPLLGFILMIDSFRKENGATRFVPGSHRWPGVPSESMADTRVQHPAEYVMCGPAGTMVLFDGSVWHGHTANVTAHQRRSIQGYFVRKGVRQGFDFSRNLPEHVQARMTPLARRMLALDTGE